MAALRVADPFLAAAGQRVLGRAPFAGREGGLPAHLGGDGVGEEPEEVVVVVSAAVAPSVGCVRRAVRGRGAGGGEQGLFRDRGEALLPGGGDEGAAGRQAQEEAVRAVSAGGGDAALQQVQDEGFRAQGQDERVDLPGAAAAAGSYGGEAQQGEAVAAEPDRAPAGLQAAAQQACGAGPVLCGRVAVFQGDGVVGVEAASGQRDQGELREVQGAGAGAHVIPSVAACRRAGLSAGAPPTTVCRK